jgi:hypothetical protein
MAERKYKNVMMVPKLEKNSFEHGCWWRSSR